MNPIQQDPAYEYCLGSEALQKWGPKTEDMEMSLWPHEPESYTPVEKGSHYSDKGTYRRKRQTIVQEGEEWIEFSNRRPTCINHPIWIHDISGKIILSHEEFERGYGPAFIHWKPAKLPAPPKPKQKTQQEIDEEAIDEMVKSTEFSSREPNLIFWFRQGARSALAWESSRGKEDGK